MCDELANKRIASKGPLWRMKESLPNICIFCLFKLDKKDFASLSLSLFSYFSQIYDLKYYLADVFVANECVLLSLVSSHKKPFELEGSVASIPDCQGAEILKRSKSINMNLLIAVLFFFSIN